MVFKPLAKYKDFVLIPAHPSVGGRKGEVSPGGTQWIKLQNIPV